MFEFRPRYSIRSHKSHTIVTGRDERLRYLNDPPVQIKEGHQLSKERITAILEDVGCGQEFDREKCNSTAFLRSFNTRNGEFWFEAGIREGMTDLSKRYTNNYVI